jgi:hypothetical protein
MPAEMPPNRVMMHTLPVFHDYSVTERFGACILLNVEKNRAIQNIDFAADVNRLREVGASANVNSEGR